MILFLILCLPSVLVAWNSEAAQIGVVIIEGAKVYSQPNEGSIVLDTLELDDELPVSNIPTKGYYKVRTDKGEVGWLSGNDVRVTPSAPLPLEPPSKGVAVKKEFTDDYEHSRIIFGIGMHSLNYGGMPENLQADAMNLGSNAMVEFQFRMSQLLFWAIRTELLWGSSGEFLVDTTNKETVKHFIVPVQLGLHFSPLTLGGFRFGVGAYGGLTVISNLNVSQTTLTDISDVTYSSVDPVGTLNVQMDTSLGENVGLLFEVAYRMQQTATFPASTRLPVPVSAFQADYSGVMARVGIEFRI